MQRKERTPRDYSAGRDKVWDKERIRDREREWDGRRAKERSIDRNRTRSQDRLFSGIDRGKNMDREMDQNKQGSREKQRERGRDGNRGRHRSRERELDGYFPTRGLSEESLEWEDRKNRPRLPSGPNEVFEEPVLRGPLNEDRSSDHSPRERGMDRGPCV